MFICFVFFEEFKVFIARGNVMDMAVGVIIGGAFGKIVTSLVNDVIMPPLGMLIGKVNFTVSNGENILAVAKKLKAAPGEMEKVTLAEKLFPLQGEEITVSLEEVK